MHMKYGNHDYQTSRISTVKMLCIYTHFDPLNDFLRASSSSMCYTMRYGGRESLLERQTNTRSAVVQMVRQVPTYVKSGYYYQLVYCSFPKFRTQFALSEVYLIVLVDTVYSFNDKINLLEN